MRVVLDPDGVARGLRRVAGEVLERHPGGSGLVIVGIRRGGLAASRELARHLRELDGADVPLGTVDITLYRDDAATALPNPRIGPSEIPCAIDGKTVLLVDDVVYTGRTVRAAFDALFDYGRPRGIELFAVADRPGRELPIQPDYVVKKVEVPAGERVVLTEGASGISIVVQPIGVPSIPPGPA